MNHKLPILYSFRRCPYAIRARMGLAVAGLNYWLRETDLKDKSSSLLEYSPKGTVPVLVLPNNQIIDESLDILDWVQPKIKRTGWDGCDAIASYEIVTDLTQTFVPNLQIYKYHERHSEEKVLEAKEFVDTFLITLNELLTQESYINSAYPSLVDVAVYPFIRQYLRIKPLEQPNHLSSLMRWYVYFTNLPLFKDLMKASPRWDEESLGILTTNSNTI